MTEQEIPNETYFNRHKNVRGISKSNRTHGWRLENKLERGPQSTMNSITKF